MANLVGHAFHTPMSLYTFLLLFLLLSWSRIATPQENQFSWPDGAKAAVCLTYDDGIDSQLAIAIPDLEQVNLRGTFFYPR